MLASIWNLFILAYQIVIGVIVWGITERVDIASGAVFLACLLPLTFNKNAAVDSMFLAAGFSSLIPAFFTGKWSFAWIPYFCATAFVIITIVASCLAALKVSRYEKGIEKFEWKYLWQVLPVVGTILWLARKLRGSTLGC